MLKAIGKKIFGSRNIRELKRIDQLVEQINTQYSQYAPLSDEALKSKTDEFKKRLAEGETTDDLLPEAFAVVKEACRRLCGTKTIVAGKEIEWQMIPFDVQLIGAVVLHQGKIAEMATGEGKTLVAALPLYLTALEGKGAHLITVNDYLAKRDSEWMGYVLKYLGLSVGVILNDMTPAERLVAYNCDITYGTNNEFGFDYLRDNMAGRPDEIVQVRGHHYAIVDEVDSVLVDEARTPLIISGPVSISTHKYAEMKPLVEHVVTAQTRLVNHLIQEGEKLIKEGNLKAGARKLLSVDKGAPKNKRLTKLYQDADIKKAVQGVDNDYLRDKGQNKTSDEHYFGDLFYLVEEKSHLIDLTEKGRMELNPQDPDMFLIPDVGDEIAAIDANPDLDETQKLEAKEVMYETLNERSEKVQNVSQLLRAYALYEKDQEYVVQDGKVQIVDEFTGRVLQGRRYSDGLHQAIEAKENVKIERETQTLATITLQNYFRMYDKLAGMTGTAETEASEFWEIYKLDVMVIPTNKPIVRVDHEDLLYRSKREKYNAIIDEIEKRNKNGQPVLVGTITVDVSETISRMLKRRGIKHNVLNAKQHKREAEIVTNAGELAAVTIATNMAGRGTDIKLAQGVTECGGLHVLGTERHESRRIDRQLRGRSGRQGDPGSSIFFLSLEDDLMRLFATDRVASIMQRLGAEEGDVITHKMMTKAIERAQKKVEGRNFSIRKRLLDYDDVMNQQRTVIYDRRRAALQEEDTLGQITYMLQEYLEMVFASYIDPGILAEDWDLEGLQLELMKIAILDYKPIFLAHANISIDDLKEATQKAMLDVYRLKEGRIGREQMRVLERYFILRVIDEEWKDHLYQMDMLKEGIHLRAYGQKDPLIEYKREAYGLFETLIQRINETTLKWLWKFQVQSEPEPMNRNELRHAPQRMQLEHAASTNMGFTGAPEGETDIQKASHDRSNKKVPVRVEKKPKPNDPCPCGSGKKYKKCHGLTHSVI